MRPVKGQIYKTNGAGSCEVLEYRDCYDVTVRFIDTGYITVTRSEQLKDGRVRDKLFPSIYGVGFLGIGPYRATIGRSDTKAYKTWKNMIGRCYCPKIQAIQPTYIDCSVVEEWHNFQNYAKWYKANYIKDFHVDKDILVKGNRIYGPDFCKFASLSDNVIKARARHFTFRCPSGSRVDIYNLRDFCRGGDLDSSAMGSVHKGRAAHHKGWTKYIEGPITSALAKAKELSHETL